MEMRASVSDPPDELRRPASGTYDLIALRVEFEPDTSRFTTGTGVFDSDLYEGIEPAIDPLPHDAGYFEAHLSFLSNYIGTVSSGRVQLRTHLLPEIVRVPNWMGAYSPTGPDADDDAELGKLAALIRDAWTIADDQVSFDLSGLDPARTAFAIFHAGVGRDIELLGTSLDKTPQDLPSLFFGEQALERLGAGGITFKGMPVTSTMVLPRTENRLGTDFIANERYVFELSINGLLASSFLNFLGVPDLFDTESGESAIGPFGLMDGQGIFAYRGLFPPEPMAWTKYYLGWTDLIELQDDSSTVFLHAVSGVSSSAARATISDAEYFLIENRYRDPYGDGLRMFVYQGDSILEEQRVQNGDETFNSLNVEGFIGGVVIATNGYDWALPGGVDEDGNELNGGILIWHVDERRLRAGWADNTVNVGPETRAIDLEEADGAQDIGFPSGPFGPQADLGSPFDFFYEGNPVRVKPEFGDEIRLYQNRFGPDTYPSSATNAGGPSFIVLEDFSAPGPVMSFRYYRQAVAGIEPVPVDDAWNLRLRFKSEGMRFGEGSSVSMRGDVPVFYSASSRLTATVTSRLPVTFESLSEPAVTDEGLLVAIQTDDQGRRRLTALTFGQEMEQAWSVALPDATSGMMPVSPLVRIGSAPEEQFFAVFNGPEGSVLVGASEAGAQIIPSPVGEPLTLAGVDAAEETIPLVVGREGAGFPEATPLWNYQLPAGTTIGSAVFAGRSDRLIGATTLPESGEILILDRGGAVQRIDASVTAGRFGVPETARLSRYPVLFDVDADGYLDVIVGYGPLLLAFSRAGALADGFPIRVGAGVQSQPIVMRLSGMDSWTILVPGDDGYLYGFRPGGDLVGGFPLEVGDSASASAALAGDRLFAISEGGSMKQWQLPAIDAAWWTELHGAYNAGHAADLADTDSEPPVSGASLIDEAATYNWPNPITEGFTHVRVRTARDARVEVAVLDAAGGLVDEIDFGSVTAGVPSEMVWQANVSSGLYFAKVTATAGDGERATRVIKMAVIK